MELFTPEILQPLGVSAVLAIFLYMAWIRLKEKDKRIDEIQDKLMQKFEENTKIVEGVKHTLDKNNEITTKFLDRFDEVMRNRPTNKF